MRYFVKAAGFCLLLAHSPVQALSIGNIRVKSALNQRFNADIVLSLNAGDNPSDIHVQLAPYDKFSERGIPWDRELLKLRFEPVQSSDRSVVIRVRSNGVISEPVLVFLLQASSPKATLYRQFTVLMEPPADYEPVRIRKHAAPEITVSRRHVEPPIQSYNAPHEKRLPVRAKPSHPAPEVKRKPDWVNVRNNDSLSKIAKRLNAGVSHEQMAIALYNANPKAFFSPNINALKAGQILRVPERKALNSLNAWEARAEFYRQNRAWKERLDTPPEPQPEPPAVAEASSSAPVQKKLTLTAPTETPVDQSALLISDDINTVIKPVDSVGALSAKVQSLQERLNKMEQQMTAMQKLLLVKDEQLASLQNRTTGDSKLPGQQSWFDHLLSVFTRFFTVESKSLLYIVVGFLELVGLGLIVGYYGTRKAKTKKAKSDRY